MDYFKCEKASEHITRIYGITGEQMYLIVGSEKAALIDTGCGVGDLKGVVSALTDKPIITILTHGHVDHAMGAADFSPVYMNAADKSVVEEHKPEAYRREYISSTLGYTDEWLKDMVLPPDQEQFLPLAEGDSFNLGNLHLLIYECAGHTPGSICVLIKEEKILITGDACNPLTFMFLAHSSGVRTYLEKLKHLKEMTDGLYEKVFLSHGETVCDPELIDNVMDICRCILDGEADEQPMSFMGEEAFIAKSVNEQFFRTDGGLGNIVYDRKRIDE